MSPDVASTSTAVVEMLVRLSALMRPLFPHHATALHVEVVGTKMTNDRWNRVAAALAAIYSVPGPALLDEEHAVRNLVLDCVVIAKKMAAVTFGGAVVEQALDFVQFRMAEIGDMMTRQNTATKEQQ